TGITASHKSEGGCPGAAHASAATYKANVTVSGDNAAGEPTAISFSEVIDQIGELTSDGPFKLTGTEVGGEGVNEFNFGGGIPGVKCVDSSFEGGALGATPHTTIPSGSTTFTMSPTYKKCKAGFQPITVAMTSCDYVFTLGTTTGGGKTYGLKTDIECSVPGDEVHLELFSDEAHTNRICSITFPQQTNITGLHATDSGAGDLVIGGTATGITASHKSEGGCPGAAHTTTATYKLNITMSGDNAAGGATAISLSD
ncbi:MAG: hypothetical protein ABW196_02945, partial [Solirubrobacterales bacterium]